MLIDHSYDPSIDSTFPVWSGDLDMLLLLAPGGHPPRCIVAKPAAKIRHKIAKIALSGVVTRTGWQDFSAEVGRLSAMRSVKGIAVSFDTLAQQGEGYQEALNAVARCRRQGKPIHAHITNAVGLAYAVAVSCDKVFMEPSAKCGRGEIGMPYVDKAIADKSLTITKEETKND